jgi:hypothetical protein
MNEENDEIITDSHDKAFKEIMEILDKYFDGWIIGVMVESPEQKKQADRFAYNGGLLTAIGLSAKLNKVLLEDDDDE